MQGVKDADSSILRCTPCLFPPSLLQHQSVATWNHGTHVFFFDVPSTAWFHDLICKKKPSGCSRQLLIIPTIYRTVLPTVNLDRILALYLWICHAMLTQGPSACTTFFLCPKAQTFYRPDHCKPKSRDNVPHAGLYCCYDQLYQMTMRYAHRTLLAAIPTVCFLIDRLSIPRPPA